MSTIVIAGAGSDIGEALVSILVAQDHHVFALSRTLTSYPRAENLIYQAFGDGMQFPEIEGPIDGLVYLPGSINLKPFQRITPQEFLRDWEISVLGAIQTIQQYLPLLKTSTQASVVLVSTVAVQTGMPFHSSISASKGAVEGLARALAAEYAPQIRVNVVAPSLTRSKMASRLISSVEKEEQSAKRHPLQRIGEPIDIAASIAFLLSDQSSWITGQVLPVDGGMSNIKLL